MDNHFSNMDFLSLIEHVKQLSDVEKKELAMILNQGELLVANEPQLIYSKTPEINADFKKQWQESVSAEQFKDSVIQHINKLPWK